MGPQLGIEVIERGGGDEGLGQARDAPDEVSAPLGIELAEHVVQEEQGRTPVELGEEVELGQLEGEDGGPLLAARGERGQVAAGLLEGDVVAVRSDERRAVPDLLFGGLDQAAGERIARRLAGQCRRVGRVAQAERSGGLLRGDLGVGAGEWTAQRPEEGESLGDDGSACFQERLVPETELTPICLLLADGTQQRVTLLERPGIRRLLSEIGRRTLAGEPVDRAPAQARRARHEEHLLGREDDRAKQAGQARGSPGHAVHPDSLAAAGLGGSRQRHLDRGRVLLAGFAGDALHAGQVTAPAHQLGIDGGPVRATPGKQNDRLQEAGLARCVGTPDQLRPGSERGSQRAVAAQIMERDRVKQALARVGSRALLRRSSGRASPRGRSRRHPSAGRPRATVAR